MTDDHKETARWLMALAGFLGPKERKFVGAMCRVDQPSPAQREWLARIAKRAVSQAGKVLNHA